MMETLMILCWLPVGCYLLAVIAEGIATHTERGRD